MGRHTLQDTECLHMVLEFVPGGDLFRFRQLYPYHVQSGRIQIPVEVR